MGCSTIILDNDSVKVTIGDKSDINCYNEDIRKTHMIVYVQVLVDDIGDDLRDQIDRLCKDPDSVWDSDLKYGGMELQVSFLIQNYYTLIDVYNKIKKSPIWERSDVKSLSTTREFVMTKGDGSIDFYSHARHRQNGCEKYESVLLNDVLNSNMFLNDIPVSVTGEGCHAVDKTMSGLFHLVSVPSHVTPLKLDMNNIIFSCYSCVKCGNSNTVKACKASSAFSMTHYHLLEFLSNQEYRVPVFCYECSTMPEPRSVDFRSCLDSNIISNSLCKIVRKRRKIKLIKEAMEEADVRRLEPNNLFGKRKETYSERFGFVYEKINKSRKK